jgi:hypothetical protein
LENSLPKTIWFLWLQGLNDAPWVVRKCYESWLKHNPGWDIIFLNEDNLGEYSAIKRTGITPQAFSDILRINLLQQHGGIWVDATCFCTKPLDEWITDYITFGFFAFERPGPDRMISSWFIASAKNDYITNIYQQAVNGYWNKNPGLVFFETSKWYALKKYLKWMKPQDWFGFFATKVLSVYPYFWFHYLFENIYWGDAKVKAQWDATQKISADIPHNLQFAGLFSPLRDEVKAEIDSKASPVYKLTWKYEAAEYKKETVIDYLLVEDGLI